MAINFELFPSNFSEIGPAFIDQFYLTLQNNRDAIANFYHEQALLTYEGQQFQGRAQIAEKYKNLSWKKIQFQISKVDYQPTENGIVIFVMGKLCADEDHPIQYAESFMLRRFGEAYSIVHNIFRLILHDF